MDSQVADSSYIRFSQKKKGGAVFKILNELKQAFDSNKTKFCIRAPTLNLDLQRQHIAKLKA